MRDNEQEIKIGVVLFAIFYLLIGSGALIKGASSDSRFYIFDDLLIKFTGIVLILSSIFLFSRKEIARKGIVFGLSLTIIEVFIGVPKEIDTIELIMYIIILLIICVPGLIYFSISKNKKYFN